VNNTNGQRLVILAVVGVRIKMPVVGKTFIIVAITLAYASVFARQQLFFYPFDPDHFDPRALCNDGSRGGNILEAGMIPRNAVVHALRYSYRLLLCEGQ